MFDAFEILNLFPFRIQLHSTRWCWYRGHNFFFRGWCFKTPLCDSENRGIFVWAMNVAADLCRNFNWLLSLVANVLCAVLYGAQRMKTKKWWVIIVLRFVIMAWKFAYYIDLTRSFSKLNALNTILECIFLTTYYLAFITLTVSSILYHLSKQLFVNY